MTDAVGLDVEELGRLVGIIGGSTYPRDAQEPPHRYDQYVFQFEETTIRIEAEPSDDTIRVGSGDSVLSNPVELTQIDPWRRLVGCSVFWTWELRNNNGYLDGFQIELGRPGESWAVQFMCEASMLHARSIAPLDCLRDLRA